jgi:hypothetical protein
MAVQTPNHLIDQMALNSAGAEDVTWNQAMFILESMIGLSVILTSATPQTPGSIGDAFLVGSSATGAWAGHDGEIALQYFGWIFVAMKEGQWVYDEGAGKLYCWDGAALQEATLT